MTIQTLTVEKTRAAIKKCMKKGMLGAQCINKKTKPSYLYNNGSKCAIGAALTITALNKILAAEKNQKRYFTVYTLISKGLIKCENDSWHREIQYAHDNWQRGLGTEKHFLRVLNREL